MNTQRILCLLALFAVLTTTAFADQFSVSTSQVDIVVAPPVNQLPLRVGITAAPGFDYAAMQVQSDAPWVAPSIDVTNKSILLSFSTGTLVNASYTATITAKQGAEMQTFFVKAAVSPINVTKLIDDPFRSRVYGIHQNGLNRGAVILYDPINASFVGSITTSRKPTDLAVSNDGSELFVINSVERAINVFDLNSFALKETIALTAYTDWGQNDTSANIKVGKGNILYYTDGEWAPALRVFDRATKTVLQTVYVGSSGGTNYGCGDLALTPDKTGMIAWMQYGWTAGISSSFIGRFSIAANGTLTPVENTSQGSGGLNRDPLDTPVFISNDGKLAFVKQFAVSATAVANRLRTFPTPVYAASDGGEIACTSSAIFETETGNKVYDLPVTTTVQAVTSDYSRLVYFNSKTRTFGTVDLFATVGDTILHRDLFPPNGAIVVPPSQLRWRSVPGAQTYQVYLGTTEEAVRAATPGSPLYLGQTTTPSFNLTTSLTPGVTYYWRIDIVNDFGSTPSDIFHFTVSDISTSVSEVDTATVRGHANLTIPIDLASASPGRAWQASADVSWISFANTSGTTPATLQLIINASNLSAGLHTATLTISGSTGGPFTIPVTLRVDDLLLTMLKSDRSSPLVYGISENTAVSPDTAYLLEIDSAVEKILRVTPVGRSVTDLAVHLLDNRIYVPNWADGYLLGIDRSSFQLVRSYNFAPAGPVGYGEGDVFRVTPGAAGRLLIEEYDQWINVSLFDTAAGSVIVNSFQRQGGGASDPTGRYYYHADDNISNASLHRFDLTGDRFTETPATARINPFSYYGTRLIVASEDATRIVWNGEIYDQNLNGLVNLADYVYSCTTNGRYAFAEKNIYDGVTGQVILGMPADNKVSAFNSATNKLVVQVGNSLAFYLFAPPVSFSAPILSAVRNSNGSATLSWSEHSLETSFTIQYRQVGDQLWQDVPTAIARNATTYSVTGLVGAKAYEFRIKADSPSVSSDWSNIVAVVAAPNPTPTPTPIPTPTPTATPTPTPTPTPLPSASPTPSPSAPPTPSPTPSPSPTPAAALSNISTRGGVQTGDNVMIAGFIIEGATPKKVLLRTIGPELGDYGLQGVLANPTLKLFKPDGSTLFNDDWKDTQQAEIEQTTLTPKSELDSAIVATLDPGGYTAIVNGRAGTTGLALVEVYDLSPSTGSRLANISTRGLVQTGDDVLIGGFIVASATTTPRILVRAVGPSLAGFGVSGVLNDTVLSVHDSNGNVITNDDWESTQAADIVATGHAPTDPRESAVLASLPPGNYTAIIRGKGETSGVALIEVDHLQ